MGKKMLVILAQKVSVSGPMNKYEIAHFVFKGIKGRNFLFMMQFCHENLFFNLQTVQTR